jgi:hypothetical protein
MQSAVVDWIFHYEDHIEIYKMNYCTITPTRGDRPELLQFCLKQLTKMNRGKLPVNAYLMNDRPTSDQPDLVPRIRKGVELAKRDGFEWVFIIEDDDFYPENYFSLFGDLSAYDFVGFSSTTYYNLRNRTHETMYHPGRSSLFCTGFRISALEKFNWPKDNTTFLDIRLWEFAQRGGRFKLIDNNPCLGIKHGIGKCGGKAHRMALKDSDPNVEFLRYSVDNEAFEFYMELMNKL